MEPVTIPSPWTEEFGVHRVVILIEEKPFSSKYRQAALTLAEFQAMMNLMYSMLATDGPGTVFRMTGPDIVLPDDIKSINP